MSAALKVAASGPEPAPLSEVEEVKPRRSASVKWFARRIVGSIGTLAFIVVVNFFLFRVINPHPELTLARGRATTPAQLQAIIEKYGLNQPLPQQFLTYLKNIATLDFGTSYQFSQPVRTLMLDRLWPTLLLVGTSTILSIVFGLWIGTIAAWNRGGGFDNVSSTITVTLYSMPEWWLGLILFLLFATGIWFMPRLFPIGQLQTPGLNAWSWSGIVDIAWHLVLPVVTLALAYLAEYSLIMRSSLLDEMAEDYLMTARAKGLQDLLVRRRHAVRNALLPVVTLVSLNLGFIVSGAITVETVFSIPGLGLLTTEALRIPDIPVLQGTFFVFSAAVVVANLVSNLLYGLLDPRVRL